MKISEVKLPKEYKVEVDHKLLKQAVRVYEDSTHLGLSRVKTRSEVNKTRKKWYKQKGTGGARHGAKSAHIFVGGGVVHGPTGQKRVLKLSKKLKQLALKQAISNKQENKKLFVVAGLDKVKKTSEIYKFLKNLEVGTKKTLIVLSQKNKAVVKFISNLKNVKSMNFKDLNAYQVIKHSLLVVDEVIFAKKKD